MQFGLGLSCETCAAFAAAFAVFADPFGVFFLCCCCLVLFVVCAPCFCLCGSCADFPVVFAAAVWVADR